MAPGRNELCPCGSGRKYKRCCGQRVDETHASKSGPARIGGASNRVPDSLVTAAVGAEQANLIGLFTAGQYAELESKARALVDRDPASSFAWKALGLALRMQHRDAIEALQRAADLAHGDAEAHSNLGGALCDAGRLQEALSSLRRAIALDPRRAEAHLNLGRTLADLGQLADAMTSVHQALQLEPTRAETHDQLGLILQRLGRFSEATDSHRHAVAQRHDFAAAHNHLGIALQELGQINEAVASYRRALALQPDDAEAWSNLGNALRILGQLNEAVASCQRALELRPGFALAHQNLGVALRAQGRAAQAELHCRTALELDPKLAIAATALAELRADRGEFADAERLFDRAIAIEPDQVEAWAGKARCRKMTVHDGAWLLEAQRIAAKGLALQQEASLRFAIGKYFDDVRDFDQAFASYRRARELTQTQSADYDRVQVELARARRVERYTAEWIARLARDGTTSEQPIFIVGMPRSGTTLAEQILASHPAIFGAGEQTYWIAAAARYESLTADVASLPDTMRSLASEYLRLMYELAPQAQRVVDKMPGNFLHLGLIHAALPEARIIHMRRSPIDTCLSIYFQQFETVHPYANTLEDLAHYYGGYLQLMEHWRSSVRQDRLLDVSYEALLEDPEGWSRRMVAFVGLDWDARCLDFQRTERAVTTASKWQVRQSISKASVGRWRNYERFVGPLLPLAELSPNA